MARLVLGPDVKILPVLVGSFAHSIYLGGNPEDDDNPKVEPEHKEGDVKPVELPPPPKELIFVSPVPREAR